MHLLDREHIQVGGIIQGEIFLRKYWNLTIFSSSYLKNSGDIRILGLDVNCSVNEGQFEYLRQHSNWAR